MNEIPFTCQMVCDLSPVNKALWQHLTAIFHLNFLFQNKRPIPEKSVNAGTEDPAHSCGQAEEE